MAQTSRQADFRKFAHAIRRAAWHIGASDTLRTVSRTELKDSLRAAIRAASHARRLLRTLQ